MLFSCLQGKQAFSDEADADASCSTAPPTYRPAALDSTTRLATLRTKLVDNKVDCYLIPSGDAHGSEYVAKKDRRQAFISGFTGESSTAIVSSDSAALFVDGRYHVQAAKEIDHNWTLNKVGLANVPTWFESLEGLSPGTRIGLDATLYEVSIIQSLQAKLAPRDLHLIFLRDNLIDEIWTDRPAASTSPLILQAEYAGESASSKLATLRQYIAEHAASAYVVHNLAEIAWLLNLRGADIPFSPVFESYLRVTESQTTLYVNQCKVSADVRRYLAEEVKVAIAEYADLWEHLGLGRENHARCIMSTDASYALYEAVGQSNAILVKSPVELAKSIKNLVEIRGMKAAYLRDGVAWCTWFSRLEQRVKRKGYDPAYTEWHAAEELTRIREKMHLYAGLAYENISATAGNAALPHYSATKDMASPVDLKTPYLNDSGANYRDGTVDNTRTYHFGKPSRKHTRAYTRVLQGHIQCASTLFPSGTTGAALDAIARRPLWQEGMNFLHGTGHGIGSFLNVHEGPQRISSASTEPLRAGQMVSIEPGYYENDDFGIRIESIYLVKEVSTRRGFGGKWLGFERITQVPIDTKMVDWTLLNRDEVSWLKEHNREVALNLLKEVPRGDEVTRRWLKCVR